MADAPLVEVGSFLNRIDAELAQGALLAEGIESMVSADDMGGQRPAMQVAGVRLLIRADDTDRAKRVLERFK